MKAVLLYGSLKNDNTGERVRVALMKQFEIYGWEVEQYALSISFTTIKAIQYRA